MKESERERQIEGRERNGSQIRPEDERRRLANEIAGE